MTALGVFVGIVLIAFAKGQLYDFLYDDLTSDLNRHTIPVISRSTPLNVSLGMSLIQMISVDRVTGDVELDAWMTQVWRDERLSWDPAHYHGIQGIVLPPGSIWTPDTILYYGRATYDDRNVIVNNPQGDVQTGRAARIKVRCNASNVSNVSNDTNDVRVVACKLVFGSWTYDGLSLNLWNTYPDVDLSYYQQDDWEVTVTSARREVNTYSCCPEPYPDVHFSFTIKETRK